MSANDEGMANQASVPGSSTDLKVSMAWCAVGPGGGLVLAELDFERRVLADGAGDRERSFVLGWSLLGLQKVLDVLIDVRLRAVDISRAG